MLKKGANVGQVGSETWYESHYSMWPLTYMTFTGLRCYMFEVWV